MHDRTSAFTIPAAVPCEMRTPYQPTVGSRLFALLVGPSYLLMLSLISSVVTQVPFFAALGLVTLGASVIMMVLAVFGVRMFRHRGSAIRFTLSTALLILVLLSIYLAAIRWVGQRLPAEEMDLTAWLIVSAAALFFVVVTTATLIWFAEALVWLALLVVRGLLRNRERRDSGS